MGKVLEREEIGEQERKLRASEAEKEGPPLIASVAGC